MKDFWLPLISISNSKKNYGQLLLSFVFGIMLLGCDTQPTATNNADKQTVLDSTVVPATSVETSSVTVTADEDQGTSLMDAAKEDKAGEKTSSPMIAEKRDDSTLQATLIGEYTGMLSCKNCDGTAWTLNLHSDGTVTKTSVYTTQTFQPSLVESGVYRQDDDIITIVYDEENIETYGIQDNHLVKLDAHKKPDADYTLSRR